MSGTSDGIMAGRMAEGNGLSGHGGVSLPNIYRGAHMWMQWG